MGLTVNNSQANYMEMIRQREEEIRRAEERRREEARKAEEKRKAEEARKAEEEQRAEEIRRAEEERKEEEVSIFIADEEGNSIYDTEEGRKAENGVAIFFDDNDEYNVFQDTDEEIEGLYETYGDDALWTTGDSTVNGGGKDLDGNIDASAQSGYTGDCWLLTGLNSLSYSEAGRQAIKDAMTFNEDGSVTIDFKGLGISYTVTAEQIAAANKNKRYSSGDDDVLVFEMAIEQLRTDIANGKIEFDVNSPYYVSDTTTGERGNSSIDGGFVEQVWYLLTGKLANQAGNAAEVNKYLDKFEQNPDSTVMSCSFKGGKGDRNGFTVTDANGNPVKLYYSHAYAVKNVDGDKVTIVNPWDSSEEIVLDRATFAQYANVSYSDLSDKNKDMSGAFSKIVGAISEFVEDVKNFVVDTVHNIFGGQSATGLKDPFAEGLEEEMLDNMFGSGSGSSSMTAYILALVEQLNNGEITKEEFDRIIESLNANANSFSDSSKKNQFELEFSFAQ